MDPRYRSLLGGVLFLLIGVVLFSRQPVSSAVSYSGFGYGQTSNILLEVSQNPPVGKPGDRVLLSFRLLNRSPQTQTPSIQLRIPAELSIDIYHLPAGATFNVIENRIDWLPVLPANGELAFQLDAVVQVADVLLPEKRIVGRVEHLGEVSEAVADIWLGIPPMIRSTNGDGQVAVGQPIELQADVIGPGPLKVTWNLGDGRRLDVAKPVVVFPSTGRQEIVVEASNPVGQVTRRITLNVLPHPVAGFRPDDDTPAIGQPVTFTNLSGGQPPLTVFWDFGDGRTITNEQQPVQVYQQSGTFYVRLVVENAAGRSEAVWPVSVGSPPVADLIIPDSVIVGQPLEGSAFGDASILRYRWDMGDGRTQEGQQVRHVYRAPGNYYVTLIADNGHGEARAGRWVRVDPGLTSLFLPMAAAQIGDVATAEDLSLPDAPQVDPAVTTLTSAITLEPIRFADGTSLPEQLFAYVNAVRAQFDLPPLAYNYELSVAAQDHARDKAVFPDNPHFGTDGSTAAERLLRAGYRGGYAGEATAWGYADPRLAVEFWVNSDTHRPLLLNRLATDVGVGYFEDFSTANVWHWTAEFAVSYGATVQPVIRQQLPVPSTTVLNSDMTSFSWFWPLPLSAGQRFTVYIQTGNRLISLGSVTSPIFGSRYVLSADALALVDQNSPASANYAWQVRLEDGFGGVVAESEHRPIVFAIDPAITFPEPTVVVMTATPTGPTPTPTSIPTPEPPTSEPLPDEGLPIVVTATPSP